VYERDATADSRLQGYRLRIDQNGRGALAACLPADLYDLCEATSNKLYMPRGTSFDHHLNEISSVRPADIPLDPVRASTVVNRRSLRQILLAGMSDVVHFGHEVVRYEQVGDEVRVHFADGGTAAGDLLVIADGINSIIRQQRLPQAEILDTGLRAIYGQLPLDAEMLGWIPERLFGGSKPVLGPERRTLALGVFQPCIPPQQAAAQIAPYAQLDPVPDYLKWTLVAPIESFPVAEDVLWSADPVTLHGIATEMTDGWHPILRRMLAESNVGITFTLSIRAMVPTPEWLPSNVTVLGDSIHATTPVGGVGANTALRDAALLSTGLSDVQNGKLGLVDAVGRYEAEMRNYGYEAVNSSLWGAERVFRANRLIKESVLS
jgi:2-polyprenyl-6-methoxyphenol hydroxylase-like FAD-dependent oxidoreductase